MVGTSGRHRVVIVPDVAKAEAAKGEVLKIGRRIMPIEGLSREEADALAILKGQLAEVRKIKKRDVKLRRSPEQEKLPNRRKSSRSRLDRSLML